MTTAIDPDTEHCACSPGRPCLYHVAQLLPDERETVKAEVGIGPREHGPGHRRLAWKSETEPDDDPQPVHVRRVKRRRRR